MDERLRSARRSIEQGEPAAVAKLATELARSGRRPEAAQLVLSRIDDAGEALDLLTPPPIASATFETRVIETGGRALGALEWRPDEQGVWVADDEVWYRTTEVKTVTLDGACARLFAPAEVPPNEDAVPEHWVTAKGPARVDSIRGLAVSPGGGRLAFAGRSHGYRGLAWFVLDLASGAFTRGPLLPVAKAEEIRTCWWGERVLGEADRDCVVWDPVAGWSGEPSRASSTSTAAGTCVGRTKLELRFFRPGAGALPPEPFARRPYPLEAVPSGWDGLIAVPGGRALVVDQAGQELILLDSTRELARVSLPTPDGTRKKKKAAKKKTAAPKKRVAGEPGKLVAVRPCPSGRVVALRYKAVKCVVLLDLRDGSHARIDLEHLPRDPVWSPSGHALAIPTGKDGLLQVVTVA